MLRRLHEEAARIAQERPEVERIVLFGSVARGACVPGSDADVFVVLRSSELSGARAWVERMPLYEFHDVGCGVEVFAYTRAEIDTRLAEGDRFIAEIVTSGLDLYRAAGYDKPAFPR